MTNDTFLENLIFQMGGKLPTINSDFVDVLPITSFKIPDVNIPAESFDNSNIIALENLRNQQVLTKLNEARINAEQSKIDLREKQLELEEKKAEQQSFNNTLKYYDDKVKLIEGSIDKLTGLSFAIRGAEGISNSIREKTSKLKSKFAEASFAQYTGNKVPSELLQELKTAQDEIENLYSDPNYKKLLLAQQAYTSFNKDLAAHKSGAKGKIINQKAVKEYVSKLDRYLTDPEFDIADINDIVPNNLLFDEKEFREILDQGIEAFAKNNTEKINEFIKLSPRVLEKRSAIVQDLRNSDTFVDSMIDFLKSSPEGESFIDARGGEENMRNYIINRAEAIEPSFGKKTVIDQGTTRTKDPDAVSATSGRSSGGSSGRKETPTEANINSMREQLAQKGLAVEGNDIAILKVMSSEIDDNLLNRLGELSKYLDGDKKAKITDLGANELIAKYNLKSIKNSNRKQGASKKTSFSDKWLKGAK